MKNTESPEGSEKFGEKTEHGFSMMKKEGAMFCTSCKTTSKQNEFVKGCRSFRLESVKIHENSEVHKHACEVV